MELDDALKSRRSCRFYRSKPVPFEVIGEVLRAATLAPSSGNVQNWEFVVVNDATKREQIAKACIDQVWVAQAPVHIVVCNSKDRVIKLYPRRGQLYATQNCAVAVQNMLLKATDLGLGSCWVGTFDEHAIRRILRIPASIDPEVIVTLGYVQQLESAPPREPSSAVTHFETYGKKHREAEISVFPLLPAVERTAEHAAAVVQDMQQQSKSWFSKLVGKFKKKK